MASSDRLEEVDRELGSLGKSDEEVSSVLSRFAEEAPADTARVDAELDGLAADLEGAKELLQRASAQAPSVVGTFEKGAASRAASASASAAPAEPAPRAAAPETEDAFQEAPWPEGGGEREKRTSLLDEDLFSDTEAGADAGPDAPLDADPSLSQPPPPAGEEQAGDEDMGSGLADLLEGDEPASEPPAAEPVDVGQPAEAAEPDAGAVDPNLDFADSTDMMSADEVEAIRQSGPPPAQGEEEAESLDDEDVEELDADDFELLVDDEELG